MISNQNAFDIAYRGVINQGAVCKDPNDDTICFYRYKGLRCAIGHMIPDDLYRPTMEGLGAEDFYRQNLGISEYLPEVDFCIELQSVHDSCNSLDRFKGQMLDLALEYNLVVPECNPI